MTRLDFADLSSLGILVVGVDARGDSEARDSDACHQCSDHDFHVGRAICAIDRVIHRGPPKWRFLKSYIYVPDLCTCDRVDERCVPSRIHIVQALSVAKHDLAGSGEGKHAVIVKL